MDDLAAWLTNVWDEQEAAAKAEVDMVAYVYDRPEDVGVQVSYEWVRFTKHPRGGTGSLFAYGAPSPTQVLARIAADRKILDLYRNAKNASGGLLPFTRGQGDGYRQALEDVLRLRAAEHASRPGYQEGWAVQ